MFGQDLPVVVCYGRVPVMNMVAVRRTCIVSAIAEAIQCALVSKKCLHHSHLLPARAA